MGHMFQISIKLYINPTHLVSLNSIHSLYIYTTYSVLSLSLAMLINMYPHGCDLLRIVILVIASTSIEREERSILSMMKC